MIDTNIALRQWLLTFPAVTSLLGSNANNSIYAGDLPEHYDPANGPAIQIFTSGGASDSEVTVLVRERKHVRVWAGTEQYDVARAVYGAIRDSIHGQSNIVLGAPANGTIVTCNEVTSGQDVTDPDLGWATVVAFYEIRAHS